MSKQKSMPPPSLPDALQKAIAYQFEWSEFFRNLDASYTLRVLREGDALGLDIWIMRRLRKKTGARAIVCFWGYDTARLGGRAREVIAFHVVGVGATREQKERIQ